MIDLPDVRQTGDHDCGIAAVRCVMKFLDMRTVSNIISTQIDGTDPRTIESFFRYAKLKVISGEMAIDDLTHFGKMLRPTICVLKGHYVVVRGVARGKVHFHDPAEGPRVLDSTSFFAEWLDIDRLGSAYRQFGICVW